MRAVIQRVSRASVTIEGTVKSAIGTGLLIFLGVESSDSADDARKLAVKIARLRIFRDEAGHMNIAATDAGGGFLVISQFTLHAETRKGNRPSFIRAARPDHAVPLYQEFVRQLASESGQEVLTGEFGADMSVELVNDGPVTIVIDTKNWE